MKLYRKIFLGVMSLLLLITTFTTTTYAWFKINSSASVEGFDFQVHSGQGIHVSIDGERYYQDLSLAELQKAMLLGYSDAYRIVDGQIYQVRDDIVGDVPLSDAEISSLVSQNIKLLPLTSNNGIDLYDSYGSQSTAGSGRFLEFSLYFNTNSNTADDRQAYEIYLLGEETTQRDGTVILPTAISSETTEVKLVAGMTTSNNVYEKGDKITVKAANALRMSIQDATPTTSDTPEEDTGETPVPPDGTEDTEVSTTPSATIYEFSDESDLGSYATDYNGEDETLNYLYNSNVNAMYTYYNNLRQNSPIPAMEYANMPKTIRDLTNEEELPMITSVQSGSDAKLVTFRFWLEGWDADCFDGLDKAINVRLSFKAKKI